MSAEQSNLLGDETAEFSLEAVSGEDILVTPSKIIKDSSSSSGRAIMLSKLSMLQKTQITSPGRAPQIVLFIVFSFFSLFPLVLAVNGYHKFGLGSMSTIVPSLFVLLLLGVSGRLLYGLFTKDFSPPDDVVWFSVRGANGGFCFKIDVDEIPRLVSEISKRTEQEVTIKE